MANTTTNPTDSELVARYQQALEQRRADRSLWESELLSRYAPVLRARVWAQSGPGDDREVLLQEAGLAALRAAASWRADGGASVRTWIVRHCDRELTVRSRRRHCATRGLTVPLDEWDGDSPSESDPGNVDSAAVVAHVERVTAGLPAPLTAQVRIAVADVVDGRRDHFGYKHARSVGVRSVLAHPAAGIR